MGDTQADGSKKVLSELEVEEKEAQLEQQILDKYNKVKEMERELQVLQFQAKQTTAPKKHALELLRRKIEECSQETHEVRDRVAAMKKELQKEEEILKQKEDKKAKLCEELEKLVYFEVQERYEKLEKLSAVVDGIGTIKQETREEGEPTSNAEAEGEGATATPSGDSPAADHPSGPPSSPPPAKPPAQPVNRSTGQPAEVPVAGPSSPPAEQRRSRGTKQTAVKKVAEYPAEAIAAKSAHVKLPPGLKKPAQGKATQEGTGSHPSAPASGSMQLGATPQPKFEESTGNFVGF